MDLKRWNPWWEGTVPKELTGKSRFSTDRLLGEMDLKKIIVITGPRRSGKTTILYQIITQQVEARGFKNVLYIALDDPQFENITLDAIFEEYLAQTNAVHPLVIIDEAQEKEDWAKWVKSMYDRNEADLIVTGSTSHLVTRSYVTYLAGRASLSSVFPLSFLEYLNFKDFTLPDITSSSDVKRLEFFTNDFLVFGGYPEIVLATPASRQALISSYFDTIIARDVVARLHGDFHLGVNLARYIISSISSKISTNAIRKALGIGSETAAHWVEVFLSSYLVFETRRFSYSIKAQEMEKKKYYVVDNAFIRLVQPSFQNTGKLLENAVAMEIVKSGHDLYYWSGEHECDFILTDNGKPVIGIQVSKTPDKDREIAGLEEATKQLQLPDAWLVGLEAGKAGDHEILPFWKFIKKLHQDQ